MRLSSYRDVAVSGGFFLALIATQHRLMEIYKDAPYFVLLAQLLFLFPIVLYRLSGRGVLGAARLVGPKAHSIFLALSTLILCSWVYGVFLGLLYDVPPKYAFRNFFGLLLYALVPLLFLLKPKINYVVNAVIFAAVVQILYGANAVYVNGWSGGYASTSFSSLRTVYSMGFIVIFPLFALCLARFLLPGSIVRIRGERISSWLVGLPMLGLCSFGLVVPAMSKGYILAIAAYVMFAGVYVVWIVTITGRFSIGKICFILGACLVAGGLFTQLADVISYTYSFHESSNEVRLMQAHILMQHLTWLGSGLGAAVPGYIRAEGAPYGYELTYLNVVHKLGVASVFLFLCYVVTLCLAIYRLFSQKQSYEAVFALGCMGFLVVGAGNPVLLAPAAVILHSVSIYVLVFSANGTEESRRA